MRPLHPYDPPTAGPYRLLARLSEDTHTRSYLGTASGRGPVRVRILRSGHATDPTARAAFTHRVENTRGLRDPHVAAVLDSDLNAPVPWVATEQPLGADLAGLVTAHGALPAAALHPLAVATAQGLAALHAAQDAHGSLSPAGVLMTGERALLADPGVTPAPETDDTEGSVFTAPEGGGAPAGDVFSWAAVLCFAASGVEGPDGLDRVPLQLRGVVDACLRENANLRPSAVDLVSMLGGASSAAAWPQELLPAVESSAADMRRAFTAEPVAHAQAYAQAPAPGSRGGFVGLTAGALVLTLLVAAGASWGYERVFAPYEQNASGGDESAEEYGLITDTACLDDGIGLPELEGDIGPLNAVEAAFSHDGDVLALAGEDHGLSLWDWREGEILARPAEGSDPVNRPEFSPVGCTVGAVWPDKTAEDDEFPTQMATAYNLRSGERYEHRGPMPPELPDGTQELNSVVDLAFSPDGRWLALGTTTDSGLERDDSIGVFDTETGEMALTFNDRDSSHSLTFIDDTRVASATGDVIYIWDAETGDQLQTVRNVVPHTVVTAPDRNQLIYVKDDEVVWHDLNDDSELGTFPLDDYAEVDYGHHIRALTPETDRGLVHITWDHPTDEEDPADRSKVHRAHLWDVETGEDLLAGDEDPMLLGAAFHPEVIAGVGGDGSVNIMDPDTLEVIDTIE
ncbi:hypothetical protein [Nocardiopsis oceani]